jgi:hypothetical protein
MDIPILLDYSRPVDNACNTVHPGNILDLRQEARMRADRLVLADVVHVDGHQLDIPSQARSETPFLSSILNPEETETAIIIIRKETAMETIAILPPKRRRLAMNLDASMRDSD